MGLGLGLGLGLGPGTELGLASGLASALAHLQVSVVDWAPSVVALVVAVLVAAALVLLVVASTRSHVETSPALVIEQRSIRSAAVSKHTPAVVSQQ